MFYSLLLFACLVLIFFPLWLAFKEKNFFLNHNDLTKQPLFWGAIFWPASASLALGIEIWLDHTVDFSPQGYDKFIEISKLPLGVLALTIPVTAVIAAIHRSIQTAKQIEETQIKNTADLYYSHKKFFIERLEKYNLVPLPEKLYSTAFPNNSVKNISYIAEEKSIKSIIKLNEKLNQKLEETKISNDLESIYDFIKNEFLEHPPEFIYPRKHLIEIDMHLKEQSPKEKVDLLLLNSLIGEFIHNLHSTLYIICDNTQKQTQPIK